MRKYIAEFIGTFILVLFACGVAAVTGCSGEANASYILTALAFGGVIIAMAYSIGNISGCHINPAVSLGMLLTKRMELKDFAGYVASQVLGAIVGATLLRLLIGTDMGLGANGLYQGDVWKSFIIETVLSAVFILTILAVTRKRKTAVFPVW